MSEHFEIPLDAPVYVISVAAEMAGMHPQTLRQYDRLGLVTPTRTMSGGRRYSLRDIVQLREVQRLSQEDGVNLAGVKRIIDLENQVEALQQQLREALTELSDLSASLAAGGYRRAYLPARAGDHHAQGASHVPSSAVVVYPVRRRWASSTRQGETGD
jgi:MerR family transcriptional regulator/heat shock protein HspR